MKTAIDALKNESPTCFQVKRLMPGHTHDSSEKGMFLEIGNQTYWVSQQISDNEFQSTRTAFTPKP